MSLPLDPQTLPIAATGFPAPIERHWDTLCRNNLGQLVDGNGVVVDVEAGAITGDGNARLKTSVRVGSGAALAAIDGSDGQIGADGASASIFFADRSAPRTAFAGWYRSGAHVRLNTSDGGDVWDVDPATGILTRTLEGWTVISTFSGTWADATAGSNMQTVRWKKNALGEVWLIGSIKSGTIGTTAFTLPAGARPLGVIYAVGIDQVNALSNIIISTAGVVTPLTGSPTNYITFVVKYPTV